MYILFWFTLYFMANGPMEDQCLTEPVAYIVEIEKNNMFTMHGVSKTWLVYPTGPCIQLGITARWEFLNDQSGIDLFY